MSYKKRQYFVYDPEGGGMAYFDSEEESARFSEAVIREYLGTDGWDPEVVNAVTGKVTHSAQRCNYVPRPPDSELDEYGMDSEGTTWDPDWVFMCDYKLKAVGGKDDEH